MRFSRLSLERYGHFEGRTLAFRSGSPDLHIIYGANEAGKTTSLSAVSDLLFGFPARSPHNFVFDYSLLRIGALLEDGDRIFECRRKKGTSATLLNAADAAIDEAPLVAMLRGQTRETFGFSFGLDQESLRSGGRAIVEAKNDFGRALFAAGSGLIGIADELRKLELEADAIWAPTAAQRRTFTQAQRLLTEATRAIRDNALRPKAWTDAEKAAKQGLVDLDAARKAREEVQSELRRADRIRRLAPLVRQRAELLENLRSHESTRDLGQQREDSSEATIKEADNAEREGAAAERLRSEAADRRGLMDIDAKILARADDIDRLHGGAGANEKGAEDLVRLDTELVAVRALIGRLRMESGSNAMVAPARATAAKLRDLAQRYVKIAASNAELAETAAGIEDRRQRSQAELDAYPIATGSDALFDAVDAARSLGTDLDARCAAARRKSDAASAALAPLLARLSPWNGTIDDLLVLPRIADGEIETTKAQLADMAATIRREDDLARRSAEQVAAIELETSQIGSGTAISPEDIASAKGDRERHWQPIRNHVLTGGALASPADVVAEYEARLARVDERMELRYTLADASGRLALLEQKKAELHLQVDQAVERSATEQGSYAEALAKWNGRLTAVGLPQVEPVRFESWQADRDAAEASHKAFLELQSDRDDLHMRRNSAREALSLALGLADTGGPLASVLASAERQRTVLERAAQQRLLSQKELDQAAADATALKRRQRLAEEGMASSTSAWREALSEAGLDMDPFTCGAILDVLDELREAESTATSLERRAEGIRRDAREHMTRVDAIGNECGIATGDGGLRELRDRLVAARAAVTQSTLLENEERRRATQVDEAAAKMKAAEQALAPLLAETGLTDRIELALAIERSRIKRRMKEELSATERQIIREGDGLSLDDLVAAVSDADPDQIAERVSALNSRLGQLNLEVDRAAAAHGAGQAAFEALNSGGTSAVNAATDAEQARAELEVLTEHYILKRAQAVTLRWTIEKYRERHQDPLLLRAGELFSALTIGRYSALRVDADGPELRLMGLRDDGRAMVDVGAMSEGTIDQLFLALRLAALEQSVAAGVKLPFLADDLFVNFDDRRAEAGFKVLAEVARSTQVLFFTHHPHLVAIAKSVVGAERHSECELQ